MDRITESHVEEAALDILKDLGYSIEHGPEISPEGERCERASHAEVVLKGRLTSALERINPTLPREAIEEAVKKVLRVGGPKLLKSNELFHKFAVEGVSVEYKKERIKGDIVKLFDFENPKNNEFLAVNQFTIKEDKGARRPDIILFVNGLPIAVIELKNPADENATIWSGYNQLQTYMDDIPSLFNYNELLITSDGTEARAGTISSNKEWFLPWKSIDGGQEPKSKPQLSVLLEGMFNKTRILDIIQNFILFKKDGKKTTKILSAYHQYYATNCALKSTKEATKGTKRCGVVWHTQGSGKSLTMAFYAGKLIRELDNPTVVVLTDRNDLDDQLFATFSAAKDVLRQDPKQADSREKLKEFLKVASGGVVFTTIQKFFPESKTKKYPLLSERKNIVVIADEAHRSQYDFIDGFARHMRDALPNASFIGFTGTPIELADKSTRAVFGDYIHIYDIQQAVEDCATVKIYYESRLAKLELKENERPHIDPEFEEITENEEQHVKEKLKSKWARLEAIVGSKKRVKLIAKDIVNHFEKRQEAINGKAMIVCMSRRICVELYDEIVKLRPDWHKEGDDKGEIKVVMTGSASDKKEWQKHIRNKPARRRIADRFKDPKDPLKLAIVRDMWLTGFDVPCLHTLYLDKPMRAHGLMQAIARVNRVYKDKPGGVVVDYLGVAEELRNATATYTQSGGKGDPVSYQEDAIALMEEKYEIVEKFFHGFNYGEFFGASPKRKMELIPLAMEHVLSQKDGKARYLKYVTELSKAFALAVPAKEALKISDEVGFFQAIRAGLAKSGGEKAKSKEDLETALNQVISKSIATKGVIDIFEVSGLKKPEISLFSEEFLKEIGQMEYKNLALEALRRLLNDEIRAVSRRNIIEGRKFSEILEKSMRRYQNRSIDAAKIVAELIELAKEIKESKERGEKLGLNEDELAFYDALLDNESARKEMKDETLRKIAREIAEIISKNTSIDWEIKESVRSKLKVLVKRALRRHKYPPDKQESATDLVLKQAELSAKKQLEEDS